MAVQFEVELCSIKFDDHPSIRSQIVTRVQKDCHFAGSLAGSIGELMKQNNCYSIVIPVPRCHPGKGRSEK